MYKYIFVFKIYFHVDEKNSAHEHDDISPFFFLWCFKLLAETTCTVYTRVKQIDFISSFLNNLQNLLRAYFLLALNQCIAMTKLI